MNNEVNMLPSIEVDDNTGFRRKIYQFKVLKLTKKQPFYEEIVDRFVFWKTGELIWCVKNIQISHVHFFFVFAV